MSVALQDHFWFSWYGVVFLFAEWQKWIKRPSESDLGFPSIIRNRETLAAYSVRVMIGQ